MRRPGAAFMRRALARTQGTQPSEALLSKETLTVLDLLTSLPEEKIFKRQKKTALQDF